MFEVFCNNFSTKRYVFPNFKKEYHEIREHWFMLNDCKTPNRLDPNDCRPTPRHFINNCQKSKTKK